MRVEEITSALEEFDYTPLTSPAAGRLLYELVLSSAVEELLELGTGHGTSTAYIAAALDEKSMGHLTTIDRPDALERNPNVHQVLRQLGLQRWVTPIQTVSYNLVLMRMLEETTLDEVTEPCLDFCFIDGGHTWEADGFAFLLVDRLLRPNRWIVLDDVEWTFADSPSLRDTERVRTMAEAERSEAQVHKVVDLLIRTTPGYEVRLLGNIALAFKGQPDAQEFKGLRVAASALLRDLAGSHSAAASCASPHPNAGTNPTHPSPLTGR
jgi:predicted O-methyltransferase YrrM